MSEIKKRPTPTTKAPTTFRTDEVDAMAELHEKLLRGADLSVLLRSAALHSAFGKFRRMRIRLAEPVEAERE